MADRPPVPPRHPPTEGSEGSADDLAAVRAWLDEHREAGITVGQMLYQLYLIGLLGLYVGVALWGTVDVRVQAAGPAVAGWLRAGLPAVALLVLLAGLRLGTWAGPVLLSRADATWLLPSPLPRGRLLRPRLLAGFAAAAAVALVGAVLETVVVTVSTRGTLGPVLAAAVGSWLLLVALATALAWRTESSPRAALVALRASPVILLAVAAVAWLGGRGRDAVLWSGPWGWASLPVLAAAGAEVPGWELGALLMAVLTVGMVTWSLAAVGRVHHEEVARRAGVLAGVRASAGLLDLRAVSMMRRRGHRAVAGVRTVELAPPRRVGLAIPWRPAVARLRSRGRMGGAAAATVGAVAAPAAAPRNALALVAAALLAYVAATQLLEPMRVETENPGAARLLGREPAELVRLHAPLPTAVLALLAAAATVGAAALGAVPAGALAPALAGAGLAAPVAVVGAAVAAHRGDTPLHLLAQGEAAAPMLVGWFALGPIATAALLVPPAAGAAGAVDGGSPPGVVLGWTALYAVGVSAVGWWGSRRWLASRG